MPGGADRVLRWSGPVLDRLVELCDLALPGEALHPDELEACGEAPAEVLGTDRGDAALVLVPDGDTGTWCVPLVVVVPARQDLGVGGRLLDEAVARARRHGATRLVLGGPLRAGRHLWPGVDVRHQRMVGLAESRGFRWGPARVTLGCAATVRAPVPGGVDVERALGDEAGAAVLGWVDTACPDRRDEVVRALEHGSCLVARGERGVLGVVCHSVARIGWIGVLVVDPAHRRAGVGAALLGAACRDLMSAGLRQVELADGGPLAFHARVAGAAVSRVFRPGSLQL
ncbi:MAG: GNAT family N-acetyltransferase [Acidimicrobiia bacterium]